MKKIVASIVTILALGFGLATNRVQKSSLIVTPEGWRSSSNVSNSTMIMGRNGSKLIGFNSSSSLCGGAAGAGSNHTGGEVDPETSSSSSSGRPVIGFDLIPVVDLNGTLHLLSDEIIPVTTISGDIIYTTQQALAPLNNNNSTNIAPPLDKYRQRSDPQTKVDKNMALNDPGKTMTRSGSNMMMMTGDPLIRSGSGSGSGSNTTNTTSSSSSTTTSPPNASGKSPINLYASNKNEMLSSSRGSSSNQSPRRNDISSSSSSSKTFDHLPSSSKTFASSPSKGLNSNYKMTTDPMNNDLVRDRPDINSLTPSSSSSSNVDDPMADLLNDVLSPILSSTSLWKAGPTGPSSSSDMVLIPVETDDLFQGDLIIETDDPQDTILISDPMSWPAASIYDPAGPGTGQQQQQQQQQQSKIQDPVTMRSSSRSQNQLSSSSSTDQDSLPIGIISPELLQQNMEMSGSSPSSTTSSSGPKQYGLTGRPFPANELQAPVRLPIGVASPEQLKMQAQEEEEEEGEGGDSDDDADSGSGSGQDPITMKDGVVMMMMMGMASSADLDDPSRLMASPGQNQDPKDDIVLIMGPIGPGPGPGPVQPRPAGSVRSGSGSSMKMMDGDECEPMS